MILHKSSASQRRTNQKETMNEKNHKKVVQVVRRSSWKSAQDLRTAFPDRRQFYQKSHQIRFWTGEHGKKTDLCLVVISSTFFLLLLIPFDCYASSSQGAESKSPGFEE